MLQHEPSTPASFAVLFCDEQLLVIDKPTGLPVHPSSRYVHGTVVGRLRQRYGEGFAWPVHRLDRETSGVLVCARTRLAARSLSHAFERGEVRKEYVAICEGKPAEAALEVEAPLATGGAVVRIGVRIDAARGKLARTSLRLERTFRRDGADFCVWRAMPHTGRRHQVRAHLRAAGFPMVGDKIYGPDERFYGLFCDSGLSADDWARLRLPRQALHAAAISLSHPANGRFMRFCAPWPADLLAFLC